MDSGFEKRSVHSSLHAVLFYTSDWHYPSFTVNVQRWERSVQDEEDFLQRCKQAESKHKAEIETDKLKIEQLKQEKNEKKKVVDQMEEETAKVKWRWMNSRTKLLKSYIPFQARRDVAALAKELHNINYVISTIDTKIETKKNEKHNLLIQSKVKCCL